MYQIQIHICSIITSPWMVYTDRQSDMEKRVEVEVQTAEEKVGMKWKNTKTDTTSKRKERGGEKGGETEFIPFPKL